MIYVNILLMEEILHQLSLVVYPIIYDGFYTDTSHGDFFGISSTKRMSTACPKLMMSPPKGWRMRRGTVIFFTASEETHDGFHGKLHWCNVPIIYGCFFCLMVKVGTYIIRGSYG